MVLNRGWHTVGADDAKERRQGLRVPLAGKSIGPGKGMGAAPIP
jgi:hypothetical protein